jgi:hypothetical protein
LSYRTPNIQKETTILTNLILLPESQAKELPKRDPGIFRLNWYFMETDVGCVLGNAEFGLLVPYDGTESMLDQVISDLVGNAPGEVTPETYISRKLYLDSYTTIPEPLGQRFREVKEGCTSFEELEEKAQILNHKPFKLVDRKDGKAKAPVDWIYELFESLDDAFSVYTREEGFVRCCWNLIRGRKPYMFAYFAVRFGHSYKDFLLRDKSQDDAVFREGLDE